MPKPLDSKKEKEARCEARLFVRIFDYHNGR